MDRLRRGILVSAPLIVLLAAVAWWWYARRAPAPTGIPRGGQVIASVRAEPRSFNRLVSRDRMTELVTFLTQGRLVRVNRQTQQVEPWLADRWTSSEDGLTYTLHLRPGLTWSDGVPFTASDVAFTFAAIYDTRAASVLASAMKIGDAPLRVTTPDAATVVVSFPAPFGPGIRLLDNVPILPKHKLAAVLQGGTFAQAWNAATPVTEIAGTGPFVLQEYAPGQRLVFARNPRYWRRDAYGVPLPYLDRLVLEIVPDQNAELLRLQAGQIDMTMSELRADDYAPMKRAADKGQVVLRDLGAATDADAFWFLLNPEARAKDPRWSFLQKPEFRRVLSHAVNRQAFAEAVFLGAAEPVFGPVTPANVRWYWPGLPKYDYDPAQAAALLSSLDLEDRDRDGVVEDAAGTEARFTLITQKGRSGLERGAATLRDEAAKVGIAFDIVALDPNALVDRLERGDYDAMYFGFTATDPDPAMNKDFWLSSGSAHVWNIGQKMPSTQWERRIDTLMLEQAATLDDDRRHDLFNVVQRILAEQAPIQYFGVPRVYIATSRRVVHLDGAPASPQVLWSADTLAVAPDR